jgi:hypothetical protein
MKVRKLILLLVVSVFTLVNSASAQRVDAAFGVGSLTTPGLDSSDLSHSPQKIGGGAYPAFSVNYLMWKNLGVNGEVAWRSGQNLYFGSLPYRPILYDFNAVYAPPLGRYFAPNLLAGIGAQSTRFYQGNYTCGFTGCTNYTSSNHFLTHLGAGLSVYVHGSFFVRPEAHVYFVRNNQEFTSGRVNRYGLSIGYSFGREQD